MTEYSEEEKRKILLTIDQDIALCQTWASYWQAMAITGVAKTRRLFHGVESDELTDEEKIKDAMNIASTHLHRMSDLINLKKQLI